MHDALQVGEVGAVVGEEGCLIGAIGTGDALREWIGRGRQPRGIDQLLGDLVEVAACALDRGPARLPLAEVEVVLLGADDLVEVLEDEQKLRQLIQRLVAVAELRPVAVLGQDAVAEPVDGRDIAVPRGRPGSRPSARPPRGDRASRMRPSR